MVLDGWTRVVTRYAAEVPRFAPHLASVYAALAERHPDESQAAAVDLTDNVLAAMCVDGAELFYLCDTSVMTLTRWGNDGGFSP